MPYMNIIESKQFGSFTVEIYPDEDCENPLNFCNKIAACYEYGNMCQQYRNTNYVKGGEDGFLQYLATIIHPDFPDDTSYAMNEHREAIVKKHFARSQVSIQGHNWLEIVVQVSDLEKEGSSLSAKKYVDSLAETYKTWMNGKCVGFITKENGIEIDSCWGFYSVEESYEHAKACFPTRNDQYYFDKRENG